MYESSSFKTKNGQPHVVSNLYDFYLWTQEEKFRRMSQVLFFIQNKWMGTNVVKLKKDNNSFINVIHTHGYYTLALCENQTEMLCIYLSCTVFLNLFDFKGIVHPKRKMWCLSAYAKGIQDRSTDLSDAPLTLPIEIIDIEC